MNVWEREGREEGREGREGGREGGEKGGRDVPGLAFLEHLQHSLLVPEVSVGEHVVHEGEELRGLGGYCLPADEHMGRHVRGGVDDAAWGEGGREGGRAGDYGVEGTEGGREGGREGGTDP